MSDFTVYELVAPGNVATFVCARRGELIYKIDMPCKVNYSFAFKFSIPMEDMGDGEFLAQAKAIFFLRWIRKALDAKVTGELDADNGSTEPHDV